VLGANKSKLLNGNRKDSETETWVSVQNALQLEQRQGNPGGERDGKVSGRLQVSRLSSKTFKICRLSSILHCSEVKNLLKMWQSINGLIDQRTPKDFESVLLSLRNVVHSDNDEESLYVCCCTQKVTVKECHRYSILAVAVHRYLHEVQ